VHSYVVSALPLPFTIPSVKISFRRASQSWLTKLKNDTRLIILAAAQAQKAADYILGKETKKEEILLD
jgi:antirestriction protein ArdC